MTKTIHSSGRLYPINPGLIFDWKLADTLKILDLLGIENISFDKRTSIFSPIETRIGFFIHSKESFINCEYCDCIPCRFREKGFFRGELDHAHKK